MSQYEPTEVMYRRADGKHEVRHGVKFCGEILSGAAFINRDIAADLAEALNIARDARLERLADIAGMLDDDDDQPVIAEEPPGSVQELPAVRTTTETTEETDQPRW